MASFFQRLFKIGQSEAHAVLDNMEDPIRMTEQGIRDLKNDLQASMTSLAEVKSVAIRLKKDGDSSKSLSAEYERKAMLLLQKMQSGEMDQAEAERLATEALKKKEETSPEGYPSAERLGKSGQYGQPASGQDREAEIHDYQI